MASRRRSHSRRGDRYTRRLLRSLIELYQLLRTPQPLDDLLQAILDTALSCVPGAQRGSLLVLEGDRLVYRAAQGYDLETLRRVSFPSDPYRAYFLPSRVAQIDDFIAWDAAHLNAASNAILREFGYVEQIRRSLLGGIYVGGRFYGALVLDNLRSHKPYPPEAETLAMLFAEQAGALIEQALLIEQLRQTSTMLIEAEKLASLGRYIAGIAHEINNPLTAVLGYADFLAASDLGEEPRALLAQLRVGAERVRQIVRNLQLFARQQRQGAAQVNMNLLVEQTLTLKRGDLSRDQIEVRLDLSPDLPFSWGDAGQISQVLLNLIVNSQHALQQVPPPRILEIQTALVSIEGHPAISLMVADNGPGVAPSIAERIFEPFFTTKAPGEGTGLGLSICQGIVHAHGGTIAVATRPSGGAAFTVVLPLRLPPEQPREAAPPASRAPAPDIARPQGLAVLLAEDDPAVVDVVLRSLDSANHVVVASNGREALRMAADQPFDVVLCDLRMPEMDGLELYERLRAGHPELAGRVLFISGDTSSLVTREALDATGRPLLAKPFTPEELYGAIRAL